MGTRAVTLVIVGAGGHASDVIGLIEDLNSEASRFRVVGLVDDDADVHLDRFASRGVKVLGRVDDLPRLVGDDWHCVAAVGYPEARFRVVSRIGETIPPAAPLVHPLAHRGTGASLEGFRSSEQRPAR